MAIHPGPAFLGIDYLGEAARPLVTLRVGRRKRQAVADEYRTERAVRMIPRQQECLETARGEADHDGPFNSNCVQHRQSIGDKLPIRVRDWIDWSVGEPIAAWIKCDDLVISSQGVDLRLPVPGMNDRPGWQQQDSRLAGAIGLVIDPDAGPLDVSLLVGLSRSQLLHDLDCGLNRYRIGKDVADW